tara:strand:- start:44768 stop:45406 length:639 start_codon:yes stop_codon:yes gene_type:complete
MTDILDTRFEGREMKINQNNVYLGDDINLIAKEPALKQISVAVGWDSKAFGGMDVDVDISLFLLDRDDMTRENQDFVFYNNMEAYNGAVKHEGDNRTGAGDGDDETMLFDLHGIPFDVTRIVFVYSIYRGKERDQNLGLVKNSYIRLKNAETDHEIVRFNLDEHFKDTEETAAIVGSINREGPKWHFTPRIEKFTGGLAEIATNFGCTIIRQ